ncbi:type II toxin-antitoxin system VapC family toxin [Sinosporangium siamense]|uniref:Ribonuclease VapC n=1 Tax=Sinosporangium siamense TaxID=1367973 RepID=A0A919VBH0_9ACTN|nr:PIN domain-containing protein [Sinosporangium siamense]GII92104.1 ribonuclease VapC [Sinosporangium siamense]
MIVIADSSGVIAASDRRVSEHAECLRVLNQAGLVVVSPLVLAEVGHIAGKRLGKGPRAAILDFIVTQVRRMRFVVPETDISVLERAIRVQRRYAGLNLDLADAVNVALASVYRTDVLLTLDRRDFRAVRPLTGHKAFRLLPDDL